MGEARPEADTGLGRAASSMGSHTAADTGSLAAQIMLVASKMATGTLAISTFASMQAVQKLGQDAAVVQEQGQL